MMSCLEIHYIEKFRKDTSLENIFTLHWDKPSLDDI